MTAAPARASGLELLAAVGIVFVVMCEARGKVVMSKFNVAPGLGLLVRQGRPSERRRIADAYFREQRRTLIEQAPITTEQREGRVFVVRHLASQYASRERPGA